jgi:hypothetical protein
MSNTTKTLKRSDVLRTETAKISKAYLALLKAKHLLPSGCTISTAVVLKSLMEALESREQELKLSK